MPQIDEIAAVALKEQVRVCLFDGPHSGRYFNCFMTNLYDRVSAGSSAFDPQDRIGQQIVLRVIRTAKADAPARLRNRHIALVDFIEVYRIDISDSCW